jgi:hypothetical protein
MTGIARMPHLILQMQALKVFPYKKILVLEPFLEEIQLEDLYISMFP